MSVQVKPWDYLLKHTVDYKENFQRQDKEVVTVFCPLDPESAIYHTKPALQSWREQACV